LVASSQIKISRRVKFNFSHTDISLNKIQKIQREIKTERLGKRDRERERETTMKGFDRQRK